MLAIVRWRVGVYKTCSICGNTDRTARCRTRCSTRHADPCLRSLPSRRRRRFLGEQSARKLIHRLRGLDEGAQNGCLPDGALTKAGRDE